MYQFSCAIAQHKFCQHLAPIPPTHQDLIAEMWTSKSDASTGSTFPYLKRSDGQNWELTAVHVGTSSR